MWAEAPLAPPVELLLEAQGLVEAATCTGSSIARATWAAVDKMASPLQRMALARAAGVGGWEGRGGELLDEVLGNLDAAR